MTPELATKILTEYKSKISVPLLEQVRGIYSNYTAQEFSDVIAYIRAEITLDELDTTLDEQIALLLEKQSSLSSVAKKPRKTAKVDE